MRKFIRLDFDKNFRGSEHKSSFTGDGEHFENGISCYEISKENIFDAIISLSKYWFETASACDFSSFDINIFEGEHIGYGANYEDLATCTKHLHCIDGVLFDEVYDLYYKHETYLDYKHDEEMLEDEDYITTEDFKSEIENMFKKYI